MFALIKYASELFQYNNLSPPEWLLHLFWSLEVIGSIPELCWFVRSKRSGEDERAAAHAV